MDIDLQLHVVDVGMSFGPELPSRTYSRTYGRPKINAVIFDILKDGKEIKTKAIITRVVEVTGCKRMSVAPELMRMRNAGVIEKHPRGYHQMGDANAQPAAPPDQSDQDEVTGG